MKVSHLKATRITILAALMFLFPFQAWAVFWYVDAGINASGNGTSWGQAVKTIQEAIDLSQVGDEVWVKQGTYQPQATIQIGKSVALYGGFTGTETERSQRDWENNTTIVDGQDSIKCILVEAEATINGFTIKNGNYSSGAGMHIRDKPAQVINCTFEDNSANYGGGMYIHHTSPLIKDCRFVNNDADWGGGIRVRDSEPTVIGCTFTGNRAFGPGPDGTVPGGMSAALIDSAGTFKDCKFTDHNAEGDGGIIYNQNSSPTIEYCEFSDNEFYGYTIVNDQSSPAISHSLFTRNISDGSAAGMYNGPGSAPIVRDCSFIGNSSMNGYGLIINSQGSSPTFIDCYFEHNSGDYSVILNGTSDATFRNCIFYDNGGGIIFSAVISNESCSPQIINCLFHNNRVHGCHGIANYNASPEIINSVFVSDLPFDYGPPEWGNPAIYNADDRSGEGASNPTITNCIFRRYSGEFGNIPILNDDISNALVTYSNVEGGYPGIGNIDVDPKFKNPANGDFRIMAGSPCIDAGDNYAVPASIDTDLGGGPRFLDDPSIVDTGKGNAPIVDMGAYEYASPVQTGALKITLGPSEANSAGARWRIDVGEWQKSGVTIQKVTVGDHPVEYKPVEGWTAPKNETVVIINGETATLTSTYVRQTGLLKVSIGPSDAVTAGARWRPTGETEWFESGETLADVDVGSHSIEFKSISGWTAPANKQVTIESGKTKTINATYEQQKGSLKVSIEPSAARSAGARWRVDGGSWRSSGYKQDNVPVGSHTIEFKAISDWATPGNQLVTVKNNETTSASVKYSKATGALTVTLYPSEALSAGAQWRVDGGAWHNSPETESGLATGSHMVEYKDLSGWIKPNNQMVSVDEDQTTTVNATYAVASSPVATGSLKVTIVPSEACSAGARWRVDGGEWRETDYVATNLSVGDHTVEYKEMSDWVLPNSQTVTVSGNQTTAISGSYEEDKVVSPETTPPEDGSEGDGGGGGGGGGVFGAVSINDVIGYHLDAIRKDGTQIYMPVTEGYKALKGAQTHIEGLSPALAKMIRGGFESLERRAEANQDGVLYWIGTHSYPILGKIAEFYLDAVDSEDLMTDAYSDTIASATEFDNLRCQGIAICPHVVKDAN